MNTVPQAHTSVLLGKRNWLYFHVIARDGWDFHLWFSLWSGFNKQSEWLEAFNDTTSMCALSPRDLCKTEAVHSGSEGAPHRHLLSSCSFTFFFYKSSWSVVFSVFWSSYVVVLSVLFGIYQLSASCLPSSPAEVTVKLWDMGHFFRPHGGCWSPDLSFQEVWCPDSTLRLGVENMKPAKSACNQTCLLVQLFFPCQYPYSYSLSSDLIVSLLFLCFKALPLTFGYTSYPSACRSDSPCVRVQGPLQNCSACALVSLALCLAPPSSRFFIKELPVVTSGFCSLVRLLMLLRFSGSPFSPIFTWLTAVHLPRLTWNFS